MNRLPITAAVLLMLSACTGTPKTINPLSQGSLQAQQIISKAQWRCDGDTDRRWHCHDASNPDGKVFSSDELTPPPAEPISDTVAITTIEERTFQSDPNPAETAPKKVDVIDSQTMTITAASLDEIPDNHFAVQLIAAQDMKAITNYRQDNPHQQTIELQTVVNEKRWYILLLGVYPSYEAANSAISTMLSPPSTHPWIRPIGPLKQSITSVQ